MRADRDVFLFSILLLLSFVMRLSAQDPNPPSRPEPAAPGSSSPSGDPSKVPARAGIPVRSDVVVRNCQSCHKVDSGGLMGRISYLRKTPEGWEQSLKRMMRHHALSITPDDAREMVAYLANDHGLARAEAERALYEAERRVHGSEASADAALRETCSSCHTLGRVLSQQRDATEWRHLKAMHVAFFPLSEWQAFGGGSRRGGGPAPEVSAAREARDGQAPNRGQSSLVTNPGPPQRSDEDRADRVLARLAESQGLFTPDWESWTVARREVPLAGTWTLSGYEPGRGALRGTVELKRTSADAYDSHWRVTFEDGSQVRRRGKGVLYAGYSWRGRSQPEGVLVDEPPQRREVLLLSSDWNSFRGRLFAGEYHELGLDVVLTRHTGALAVHDVENGSLMAGSRQHRLTLHGESFPADLSLADLHLGAGVRVTAVSWIDSYRVDVVLDVDGAAPIGGRGLSLRSLTVPTGLSVYDTVDSIKVFPEEGVARVGGTLRGKQHEIFDAWAMHRGPDGKSGTADDWKIRRVPARWSLEEFPTRLEDDDVGFVGVIDAASGRFTPGLDGPNPARRWQANNIGEVYVVAVTTLNVPSRVDPPAPKRRVRGSQDEESSDESRAPSLARSTLTEAKPREFRARGHLLVTVPLWVQWDRYEWDQR